MSKITIKHFLNTNLKPYVINKKNYYSIYVLITANRKTTKLKSNIFTEYYTNEDFEDIFNSENENDKNLVENEITAIKTITEISINALSEFNTAFVTAYINFSNSISIYKPGTEIKLYDKFISDKANILQVDIIDLFVVTAQTKEISIFEFYSIEYQTIALDYLKNKKIKNPKGVLEDINTILFYTSIEYFHWYIEGNKKNSELISRFRIFFDTYKEIIISKLEEKYK